ncbi:MAG: acetyl-CoA decarbonylase/synthase complex subunit alpha/beta [Candidatus Omnitrophota bacterium]|nr:acetyl-CoA decarbonylase/synthase complex subunit alpha/beta [Candidatus Omnitrophota bacterium]
MSKQVATAVINGAGDIFIQAQDFLNKAIKEKGLDAKLSFPETAFYLPLANALLGLKTETLKDCLPILVHAKSLLAKAPLQKVWLPYLGDALNSGMAALFCEEIIVALRYLYNQEPQKDCVGFFTDTIMRQLGIQLVDGRMPGFAAILGAAPDNKTAVEIVRELQERNILTFVGSSTGNRSIIDQLIEENVQMGWDNYIVPYGRDTISAIYPLNWAIRSALTFGGLKPGDAQKCLLYTKERVFAFGLTLGKLDDIKYATGAGAINMGFPIIADTDIPQIKPSGITVYEALVKELDYKKIVPRCIDVRGLKVKVSSIPIPMPYAAAFEGERVKKEQLWVEFGGKASSAFEYLTMKKSEEVEDGKFELIGPDIDQLEEGSKSFALAIIVEVSGRKMQKDFEPILERQIHRYINYAFGIMHVGQRDMNWIRISINTFNKGFRLKHIGVILHAMLHQEYSAIVDKVQARLYTRKIDVDKLLPQAKKVYDERDERLSGMTDESVDTYYSCSLCQSFAPNHVCIVTPERLGLCGAYSWLDARASFEIMPSGPNQPIIKGQAMDERLGQWQNVNETVRLKSNKTIEKVSMYSLMDSPQSSCGCFECIVAIIPEANGVMIVHRDYSGMTPCGMSFTTLAGSVGGGVQTPGFLGIGKLYILSKKFISAEGGLKRLVWMPKELKDALADKLKRHANEIGESDLIDKIADETTAVSSDELLKFLEENQHPALKMEPMMR